MWVVNPHDINYEMAAATNVLTHTFRNLAQELALPLGEHHVLVRWIRGQQCGYAGVQDNGVAVADVCIFVEDLKTDAGDLFLMGDNIGVPLQSRVIGFATHQSISLLRGAITWLAGGIFFVPPGLLNYG